MENLLLKFVAGKHLSSFIVIVNILFSWSLIITGQNLLVIGQRKDKHDWSSCEPDHFK